MQILQPETTWRIPQLCAEIGLGKRLWLLFAMHPNGHPTRRDVINNLLQSSCCYTMELIPVVLYLGTVPNRFQ